MQEYMVNVFCGREEVKCVFYVVREKVFPLAQSLDFVVKSAEMFFKL